MEEKKLISKIGLSYFLLIVITVGVVYALTFILKAAVPKVVNDPNAAIIISSIGTYVCAMPACAFLLSKVPKKTLYRKSIGGSSWMRYLTISMFLVYAGSIVGNIVNTILGNLTKLHVANDLQNVLLKENIWITLLFAVVIGPILEELFFRKFLIDRTIVFGDKAAIVLSGLIFGLFHGNFQQLFFAFLFGCFLAYIYIRTGNIVYSISFHMVINFLNGFVNLLFLKNMNFDDMLGGYFGSGMMFLFNNMGIIGFLVLYIVFVFVMCIIGLIYFVKGFQTKELREGEHSAPFKYMVGKLFGNVGMILLMIAFAAYFVLNLWPR